MRMRRFVVLAVLGVLFVFVGLAQAQDEGRDEEPPAAPPAPAKPSVPPHPELESSDYADHSDKIEPGWLLVTGRFGTSSLGGSGSFDFDSVPRGEDTETSFSLGTGYFASGGVDFIFFPAKKRRFLLSVGTLTDTGYVVTEFEDDEYGHGVGLQHRVVHFQNSWLMFGLGYRWFTGPEWADSWAIHGRVGVGGAEAAMDGTFLARGSSGIGEIGGVWLHRFESGFCAGLEADLRGWGASYEAVEFDTGLSDADMSIGAGTFVLSIVVGFENVDYASRR